MPKLGGNIQQTKLVLPSSTEGDEAWVIVSHDLSLEDMIAVEGADSQTEAGIISLGRLIKDWNYTEDGTPDSPKVPITRDTVLQLTPEDFNFLSNWFVDLKSKKEAGLSAEEKKASGSTSVTPPTATDPEVTTSQPITIPIG
jgi:hypothetical protein